MSPKVLAFAGSARTESFNKKLIACAAARAREAGADVTELDLRDYPLPLFDQDLEAAEGMPENGQALKQMFIDHDAFLISAPEYNSSITPLLKNTIDWISRPGENEPPLVAYRGKVAGLLAASPGALGGLRGLVHVRSILGNIGVLVVPNQLAVNRAHEAFGEDGNLVDQRQRDQVDQVVNQLVEVTSRLVAHKSQV